jgi:membrane fusion protein (multidrug efflux system)
VSETSSSTIRRRRRRRGYILAALLLVVAAAGWAVYVQPWRAKPIPVTVETVAPGPANRILAVNGRIEPQTQIDVEPTVSGQVKTVAVTDGDRVQAGALLATIDDTQQKAAVSQAQSALDAARAQLEKAQADFQRAQGLGDSISQKDRSAARLGLQTARNDEARLQSARDQALTQLDLYSIKAPFEGTVITRGVDPGQVVGASSVMFVLADLTHVRASASVDELYAAEIRRGLKVKMQPSGYNQTLEGAVTFVSPTVDATTGGRLVRVSIDDLGETTLPIGLTVNLNIVVDERDKAITVPRAAILDAAAHPAVLLVRDGKAVRVPVEFVDWPAGRLIVTSGLQPGDSVITNPAPTMEGAAVAVAGR